MINRQERIKLFKHRCQKGMIDRSWNWNRWNSWFRQQPEAWQLYVHAEMLDSKGEDNMIMSGQVNPIPKDSWYFPSASQLDCCPPTCAPTPAAVNPPSEAPSLWWK